MAAGSARAGFVPVIVAVGVVGLPPFSAAVGAATAKEGVTVEAAVALADTEEYCTGYERTFHGEWSGGGGGADGGRPVLFRIGVNSGGNGCYAQLNVMMPRGVAPYELRRFRAETGGDGAWTLRYRDTVVEIDTATGTAVLRKGDETPQPGTLLAQAPAVGDSPPAPPATERARWYGKWRGRLSEVPFRVTLRFTESGPGTVKGRVSSLLMKRNFTGRFHGGMLVFRWRNRHVGLVMEPGGDTLVYNDYKGRVYRFRRRR